MTGEQLLNQLPYAAKTQERAALDEIIRLKERREQIGQHRMELEAVADALKTDAQAIEARRAAAENTDAVEDDSAGRRHRPTPGSEA